MATASDLAGSPVGPLNYSLDAGRSLRDDALRPRLQKTGKGRALARRRERDESSSLRWHSSNRCPESESSGHAASVLTSRRRIASVPSARLWRYCRLGVSEQRSDGKRLGRVSLDRAGCGALKNVSRKAFEIARRRPQSNAIKRAYEQALERTHNAVHARLTVQRKIIAILRAMWISGQPYCDEMG